MAPATQRCSSARPSSPRAEGGMRRLTGRRALATLPGLLLLAACATVPPSPTAAVAPAARDLPAAALADRLPAEAAGFERGTTVPLRLGEGGRETGYRTQGRIAAGATVDLYRQAGASVPEGIGSPAADTAFEQLVQAATRPSPHRHLRVQGEFTLPAPGPARGRPGLGRAALRRDHRGLWPRTGPGVAVRRRRRRRAAAAAGHHAAARPAAGRCPRLRHRHPGRAAYPVTPGCRGPTCRA